MTEDPEGTRTSLGRACARMVCCIWLVLGSGCAGSEDVFGTSRSVESSIQEILDLPGVGTHTEKLDFAALPRIEGKHAVISRFDPVLRFQLHSYLVHFDGLYWSIWSQGPPVEDEPGQEVRYSTSVDGLKWSPPKSLTGPPLEGYGYIARSLWVRDGKLLALAANFKGRGAFGADKNLELRAFEWDKASGLWNPAGLVYKDAINNFAPEKLPTGDWMLTRRDSRFNVYMLVGGRKALDDWKSFDVVGRGEVRGFAPDEPIWWNQPDGTQVALFRDNGGSNRLYRATSKDNGRSWSLPTRTNFPMSPSKIFSIALDPGCRVLLLNANPAVGRRTMHIAGTRDGKTFTRMASLVFPGVPGSFIVQYPNAIVHDGNLLITFSRNKAIIEALRIPLADVKSMCE